MAQAVWSLWSRYSEISLRGRAARRGHFALFMDRPALQQLPVQGLDLGILVGEAQGGLTVQLVEPVAADAA